MPGHREAALVRNWGNDTRPVRRLNVTNWLVDLPVVPIGGPIITISQQIRNRLRPVRELMRALVREIVRYVGRSGTTPARDVIRSGRRKRHWEERRNSVHNHGKVIPSGGVIPRSLDNSLVRELL